MPLGDYLGVLRRRGWLIPLVAAIAVVSAFGFTRTQTSLYRSSVRLEVSGRFDYGAQLTVERQLSPLAARILTTEIASEVDRRLKLDLGAQALLARVRAAPIAEVVQIQVDADDVDPPRAEAVVREFARVFEEQHAAREQSKPVSERTIITALDRPSAASLVWPQTRTMLLAAGILGLLVGVVLAFALDFLDDTLKSPDDLQRHLGLSPLAMLPLSRNAGEKRRRGLGLVGVPRSR